MSRLFEKNKTNLYEISYKDAIKYGTNVAFKFVISNLPMKH